LLSRLAPSFMASRWPTNDRLRMVGHTVSNTQDQTVDWNASIPDS
jgi:hypothetical protein